ncbi:DegT/DnrJ/EryC1/StrS family aminotransferase [Streptacidiphilus jiangxiensis]|uniref:dTDP-4-amino-4,6-dideoxygalactose transaminase n=1 Tax=Streptacidiphilus jiangxiensis TaxID=235985 RepID=A0A1H8ABF4_STRJI|nr:DegT/DnrJ/EryC1/StrS family aminotransferase [Streptacidiphilus jiangxiensis]SEM67883.1 dTDP-4-amino-4,6-dideoxygalactose transaminase [Streptacidiphilus jiangxiensis]
MTIAVPGRTATAAPYLPWNRPSIGPEEEEEVLDTLRSGWLTHGPKATRFEEAVRDALGVQDAFAVSSCTAAVHLGLLAAGIGPGDEVITPSLTFCAVPNAVVQCGAAPVFADVDPVTFNLDPATARAAITSRTKAITVMHYAGQPCDLAAFRTLADEHGLLLIEDAAHALHAWRDGARAGSVGDLSVFSFYANKVITCGEGGMLAGRGDLVEQARLLGRHGIDSSAWRRHGQRRTADYEVTVPGLKYTMPDITAAVGLRQWQKLGAFTAARAEIAATYDQALAGLPGLHLPTVLDGVRHGWFLYPVLVDPASGRTRDTVAQALLEVHGIGTSVHFTPVHRLAAYRYLDTHLPVTEQIAAQQLSLPCYPAMTAADVQRVTDALHALWR